MARRRPAGKYGLAGKAGAQLGGEGHAPAAQSRQQAGLYAYVDEKTWVKWVVEGACHGNTQLVLASQRNGEPCIDGKVLLGSFGGTLSLRMEVRDDGTLVQAAYREPGQLHWEPMPRGLGWLKESEREGQPPGSLAADDLRGRERAVSPLSPGWRAMIATEQWAQEPRGEIRFTEVRAQVGDETLPVPR